MSRVLKYYRDPSDVPEGYRSDSLRVKKALEADGFDVSLREAFLMWDEYSDSFCAGWLILPETDEEIVQALTMYDDIFKEI